MLRRYSLVTGALTLALLIVFGAEPFDGWNGIVQRVLVAVPLVWIAVLGAHLMQIATPRGHRPDGTIRNCTQGSQALIE